MALRRPITKALACNNCQQWILRSFIAGVGGPTTSQSTPFSQPRRTFSRTPQRFNEARERIQVEEKEEHALNDINDEAYNASEADLEPELEPVPESKHQDSHVPWYLQVQQPIEHRESPLAARQRIPDLPQHPPSILQPLLEHVSVELGMDDLSLLDLRALDPPPGLGANLLMIVGTARSEKHLHVSADRFCRWLRSEFKMRPYADGLLGRNELKLKMRRKAKRSRLLSAVGARASADEENADDGIRTGWVCVNLGRVEGGELPLSQSAETADGVVGFGTARGGSSIVVQMMTEEKRGEIDLENLWNDMLEKQVKRKEREQAGLTETTDDVSPQDRISSGNADTAGPSQQSSIHSASYHPGTYASNQPGGQQLRAYHTSSRRLEAAVSDTDHLETGPLANAAPRLNPSAPTSDHSIKILTDVLADVKAMPAETALQTLRNGVLDTPVQSNVQISVEESNADPPLVRSFYEAMPCFPDADHWHLHTELLAYASKLGHPDIDDSVLAAQLSNMQIAGLVPKEETFLLVLRASLTPSSAPSFDKMHQVFDILENMESCGYDPIQPDILNILHEAYVGLTHAQNQPCDPSAILSTLGAARLRKHVEMNNWPSFWRTWRSYPQRFLPRTAKMYQVLFEAVGDGKSENITEAVEVMRTYLPEMEREEPSVMVEDSVELAQAVKSAIEFIQPSLREGTMGGDERGSGSEDWRQWYETCRAVLNAD